MCVCSTHDFDSSGGLTLTCRVDGDETGETPSATYLSIEQETLPLHSRRGCLTHHTDGLHYTVTTEPRSANADTFATVVSYIRDDGVGSTPVPSLTVVLDEPRPITFASLVVGLLREFPFLVLSLDTFLENTFAKGASDSQYSYDRSVEIPSNR